MSIIIGAFSLAPGITALSSVKGSVYKIYCTIDCQSLIHPSAKDGSILPQVAGEIEFQSCFFLSFAT
jgi:hypothetical protein